MQIIIDSREPALRMDPILLQVGFEPAIVKLLDAGDYLVPEVNMVWSWKSVMDFCQSIYNGHLKDEIAKMVLMGSQYWQGLIVWIGDDFASYKMQQTEIDNLIEVYNAMYIPVWLVHDRLEGAELMKKWAIKALDKNFPLQIKRNVIPDHNKYPITVRMLCTINGIGPEIAQDIVKEYPTIDELIIKISCLKDWTEPIKGLGPKRAARIEEALLEGR